MPENIYDVVKRADNACTSRSLRIGNVTLGLIPGGVSFTRVRPNREQLAVLMDDKSCSFTPMCHPTEAETIVAIVLNPEKAARDYGRTSFKCPLCRASMISSEEKAQGLHKNCLKAMSWPQRMMLAVDTPGQ